MSEYEYRWLQEHLKEKFKYAHGYTDKRKDGFRDAILTAKSMLHRLYENTRRLTEGNTFAEKLRAYGLTVNQFLELNDEWNNMSVRDRCKLHTLEDEALKDLTKMGGEEKPNG